MKKLLFIIVLIISLFGLSCNNNSSSSIGKIGEIVVDPYGVTPLSAVYTTATVNATPITVKVKGLYGEPDIIHTYPSGYGTEFEIHGMFPESENTIEVNDGGRIITKNVNVGTLSYNGITIQKKYDVEINNLPEEKYKNNPDLYFLSIFNGYDWSGYIGLSKNGYVRYLNTIKTYFIKFYIEDKKILLFDSYNGIYNKNDGLYNLLGNNLIKYQKGSHHDIIKIDNDYIYLSASTWGFHDRLSKMNISGTLLEELSFGKLIYNSLDLEKYPEDEAIFKQIVFGDEVDNIFKDNNGKQKFVDWAHANSIVYDSSTDTLYASLRHRGILSIDYSEWKLIWWIADENLKNNIGAGLDAHVPYDKHLKDLKSLEAYRVRGDVLYDGPKHQHALFLHKNGNLGMFDNADLRVINPLGSRYVEYRITGTHGNYTAQKVYEYRDSSLYSGVMSDVDFTGENYQNLLLLYSYSPLALILEIEKNTKQELFKLSLPFTSYRVEKMPLYYDEGRVYSEDCNLKNPN